MWLTKLVLRVARNRWFRTGMGMVLLCLLIWFVGPMIGVGAARPLETEVVRWVVIAAVVVLWLVENLIHELRARRREAELASAVTEAGPDAAATATAEEVALLSDRLKEAVAALKKSKLGGSRRKLAAMPWYMFIGPPGAGKTTALLNCGLKFPLAETPGIQGGKTRGTQGAHAVRGVGGTRNCDWWFTDDAVLIDTAGRYTTQDSEAAVDSASWLGFLKLLKKHRRRQPLNGVLVAVSLSDLSLLKEEERLAHAQSVRRRVRELHDQLGVRVPVYVLFTKADLVEGFVEFFDNLGKEEREQVWGTTFALDDGKSEGGAVAAFAEEFDLLLARLNDRMLERVQQEPDVRRRRLIYGFPQQVASLRDVADEFLAECFRPSRLEARPLLRGVYMTSGTQEGTPIDRLLGTMAAEFGLPRQSPAGMSGTGRSYFLSRLMREVVFGEAALVSTDPKEERRARWTSRAAYAACAAVLLLLGGVWTNSFLGNKELIEQVHAATTNYNAQYVELAKRGPADADLEAVWRPLDTLSGMYGGYGRRNAAVPLALTFGLYQGVKLSVAATDAYVRAVNNLLLPRLIARAEAQVASRMGNPDVLYELLKVYLILGKKGPLDKEPILQWLSADLATTYPSEEAAPMRASLLAHTEAMLQQELVEIPLNDPLVAQARAVLTREPVAEYSYNRLLRNHRVRNLPAWSAIDEGGPAAGRVFQSRSGRPLELPGIFTWAGYHHLFQAMMYSVTKDLEEDRWVLNRGGAQRDLASNITGTVRDTGKLRRDVTSLYLDEYTRRWDALINDLDIKRFNTVQDGVEQLGTLAGPASPLRQLLVAIDQQTQLSRAAATDAATQELQRRGTQLAGRAAGLAAIEARAGLSLRQNEFLSAMASAFGTDAVSGKPADPAKRVDDHFKALHDFVTGTGGDSRTPPLEVVVQRLGTTYQTMNRASDAAGSGGSVLGLLQPGAGSQGSGSGSGGGGGGGAAPGDPAAAGPPPVAAMVQSVQRNAAAVVAGNASQELTNAWRADVLPLCEALRDRYPLVRRESAADVPVDDFAKLLGPGGKFDQFFEKYLKAFVDTTATPWRWRDPSRIPPGLQAGTPQEFERAQQIRDALFSGGQVQTRFQLTPASLAPGLARVTVDVGGTSTTNDQGPPETAQYQWPGTGGKTAVRVVLTPAGGGQVPPFEADGPWALLRLLDKAQVTPTGQPDKVRVTFPSPAGAAVFDLNASSVRNPFTLPALRSFRCPARL